MFIIRQFQKEDTEEVYKLHVYTMKYIGVYKDVPHWNKDLLDVENVYLKSGGDFLVGIEDGKIVAMGAFEKYKDNMAELRRMRVHPEYQRKGYGQRLLDELEKRALKKGYSGFHLETSDIQVAAQKLYLKNGFREVGREEIDGFNCIIFEKTF